MTEPHTFNSYGSEPMLAAVAEQVDRMDAHFDVHTVTLILDGQHGEFNLRIEATNDDMEAVVATGIAHRGGGVTDLRMEDPS